MQADCLHRIASTVVLRPIALITTHSETTGDHAAPFSFFNERKALPHHFHDPLPTVKHYAAVLPKGTP